MRHNGVGAQDEREVCPGEVRNRVGQVVAVEQLADDPVIVDVHRAGRVEVLGLERRRHAEQREEGTVVPRVRVTEPDADRLAAVCPDHRAKTRADVVERLVPPDRRERAVSVAPHGFAQPVGVVEHVGEVDALRAGESAGLGVLLVRAQLEDLAVAHGRDEAAGGLAYTAPDSFVSHNVLLVS